MNADDVVNIFVGWALPKTTFASRVKIFLQAMPTKGQTLAYLLIELFG